MRASSAIARRATTGIANSVAALGREGAATGRDLVAETAREVAVRIVRVHRAANGRIAVIAPRVTQPIVRAGTGRAASIVAGGQAVAATGQLVVATAVRGAVRRDAVKRE